jgi:hypothetical protein
VKLRDFTWTDFLLKATLLYHTDRIPHPERVALNAVFRFMGVISHKSLPPSTKIEYLDFNKTGVMEYTEFMAVCCDYDQMFTSDSKEACFKFLADGGNFITVDSLKKLFPQKGVVIEKKVWDQVFFNDAKLRMNLQEYNKYIAKIVVETKESARKISDHESI